MLGFEPLSRVVFSAAGSFCAFASVASKQNPHAALFIQFIE
jgi:hypothetical protein